ncbi:MAG: SDR family NAD(P)-dependent oxidoreductase [Sphingopyxis sp.]
MAHMLIFGMGYTASAVAARLHARGWQVTGTSRDGRPGTIPFDDQQAILSALATATHALSTVPPDAAGRDPVLQHYGQALALSPLAWLGYLSSTGVYGDVGGAWVDESAPIMGRRAGRNAADAAWRALRDGVRVFRLPGIYGPGRSAIERVLAGTAHRVNLPDQVFSRAHVDDIAGAIIASLHNPETGVFNIADDAPCSQNWVIEAAAALVGAPCPPLLALDDPALSPMARAFYAENRRVANGRAKRLLGWAPRYADYRAGLAALWRDQPR